MNADKPSRPELFFGTKLTPRHFLTARRFTASALVVALIGLVSLGARSLGARSLGARSTDAPARGEKSLDAESLADRSGLASSPSAFSPTSNLLTVAVQVAQPVDSYAIDRTYTGLVVAARTSQLGFERSARVIEMLVDEGDNVTAGTPLAKLDTRQLKAQQQRLEAQRSEASAVLAELQAGPRQEAIAVARAQVQDWNAQLELKKRNLNRTSELVRQNAVSREQHDEAELGVRSLMAKLDGAQKLLDELEAGTRKEKVEAQASVVKQLTASLADIEIEIGDSSLVAPFAGTISRRHVDEGTVVSPAQAILEIVESRALEARIGLPPRVFGQLSINEPFAIEIGGTQHQATFTRSAAKVDLATRTRTAIFDLGATADSEVVPGEVARIQFSESKDVAGFWVPTTALIRSTRGLWAIYLAEAIRQAEINFGSADATAVQADDQRDVALVARRDVEVIHTDGERSFVRGLLNAGDRMIVSGTQRVVPGQHVLPVVRDEDETFR